MSETDKDNAGTDTAATVNMPHVNSNVATVSSTDHMTIVNHKAINTNFDRAVNLPLRTLIASQQDILAIVALVAHVEQMQNNDTDIYGHVDNQYTAERSELLLLNPQMLWECQYILYVLMMLLPILRDAIFKDEPAAVHVLIKDKFVSLMNTFLWGERHKPNVSQYALTPLELSVRVTTLIEQAYFTA